MTVAQAAADQDSGPPPTEIEEIERDDPTRPIGEELDREAAPLDHCQALPQYVTVRAAP
jgi:hypothetical protein